MKLLDKKEIDLAKARERKIEIEQGRILAEKVDTLRELSAKEERSLSEFAKKTIEYVKTEIAYWIGLRDSARSEALVAQEQRDALLKPINDRAEEFKKREEAILATSLAVADRENNVNKEDRRIEEANRELDARKQDIGTFEKEVSTLHAESILDRKSAAAELREAQKVSQKAKDYWTETNDSLVRREFASQYREKELTKWQEDLGSEQRRLSLLERAIIDREETFAREQERIKNKSN